MNRILLGLLIDLLGSAGTQHVLDPSVEGGVQNLLESVTDRGDWFYGTQLFRDVQGLPVFPDSKTFPDMIPKDGQTVKAIAQLYEKESAKRKFSLPNFVFSHFKFPESVAEDVVGLEEESLEAYIDRLWPELIRDFSSVPAESSLLPLPFPALVPGGRFREAYYWDSLYAFLWFIHTSDKGSEKYNYAINILDNLRYQIEKYGYVPNGNRDYYIGRSQPPVFFLMVAGLRTHDSKHAREYLDALVTEWEFWTTPVDQSSDTGRQVLAQIAGTAVNLTTYGASDSSRPRPEAYGEDVRAFQESKREFRDLMRDIQASAESGWDFSSRFAPDCEPTPCLKTTHYAPIDLNSMMVAFARLLADMFREEGRTHEAETYGQIADRRQQDLEQYFWNEQDGFFADLEWRGGKLSPRLTPATVTPLYFMQIKDTKKVERTLEALEEYLLAPCGIRTSTTKSNQQWDRPFGWAPLQYVAAGAAMKNGRPDLAHEISTRWGKLVADNFGATGRMYEKYDVEKCLPSEAGEYPTQTGFAFTNAVTMLLKDMTNTEL